MLPEGFVRVTWNWTGAGLPRGASTVFVVENAADQDGATIVGNISDALVGSTLMANITDDVRITGWVIKHGPDETGPIFESSVIVAGTQVAASAAPNTSFLIRKSTTLGGRRGRGRMYLPGVPETNVDDAGLLAGAAVSAINTDLGAFLINMTTEGLPLMLEHFPKTEWVLNENQQPRRVPVAGTVPNPTQVVGLTVDPTVATQRRRLR